MIKFYGVNIKNAGKKPKIFDGKARRTRKKIRKRFTMGP
jgi:hypothetical protein